MVDQLTLQTIGILLTGLTVSIAAIYYMLTLRYTRRNQELTLKAQEQALETRQAQLFMQVYDRFTSYEFKKAYTDVLYNWSWTDHDDLVSKYGPQNVEEYSKFDMIGTFFEGVGVLVKRGLIDPLFVDDLMSGHVVRTWELFSSWVYIERERQNYPQLSEWFEYLYDQIKPIVEEQHPELKT